MGGEAGRGADSIKVATTGKLVWIVLIGLLVELIYPHRFGGIFARYLISGVDSFVVMRRHSGRYDLIDVLIVLMDANSNS